MLKVTYVAPWSGIEPLNLDLANSIDFKSS